MIHLFMLFWNLQAVMGIEQTFVFGFSGGKKRKKEKEKKKPMSVWVNVGSENGSSDGGRQGLGWLHDLILGGDEF